MVRLVGLEPTTGKTPVDFKPTAYANFATAAPATRPPENTTLANARNAPPSSPPKAGGKSAFSSLHLPPVRHKSARFILKSPRPALRCTHASRRNFVPSNDHFDLLVVGCGPAGEKAGAQAAYFGKRVALVERAEHTGGSCINTGTVPS